MFELPACKLDNDNVFLYLGLAENAWCIQKNNLLLLQGPLPNTCGHFWDMVWEQKSRGVVMLNRIIEKGSVSN